MLSKRSLIMGLLFLAATWALFACPTSLADTGDESRLPGPDLTEAVLTVDDLPRGFRVVPEEGPEGFAPLLRQLGALLEDVSQAQLQNAAVFGFEGDDRLEVLINLFVSPLNRAEQAAIEAVLSNPALIVRTFEERLGELAPLLSAEPIVGDCAFGERCFALTAVLGDEPHPMQVEAVLMRRGPVLSVVCDMRVRGSESKLDLASLAHLVDERVEEAVSARRSSYRAAGRLVPELTTYIPTPLDISTDPDVLAANLGLAAVATILLAFVQELVNRTLVDHEDDILRILGRWAMFDRWIKRRAQPATAVRGRSGLVNAVLFVVLALVYGLIFSLLDRNWDPFSVTGLYLFACMAIASGLVGLSGDMAAMRAARRLGMPASMNVRSGNLLLATVSAGASRLFSLVPGVWLGVPEAFEVDMEVLGEQRARQLLLAGLRGLITVAAVAWLFTIGTTLGSPALSILSHAVSAAARLADGLAGLQSLLLLAFASAMQKIFLEMSGLPGTVGGALRRSNRLLWGLGLLVAVFVYYHTLLNPQGDLAAAAQSTNVRAFMLTVAGFTVLALGVYLYFRLLYRRPEASGMAGGG